MRLAAVAALLAVLVPLQAQALETDELLGLVAMPLAVAAASEVTGVPAGELSHFVATLNRAQVPPTQIVQVVRYAPAALVVEDVQPTFIEYVDQQVYNGVTGPQLVTVIEDRYRTYDLEPELVVLEEPATTYVVRDDYIPPAVVMRVAQFAPAYAVRDTNDLLALAAMPLAVAAVSEMTGIPFGDLSMFVSSLNAARVPPLQVVEVLRYSPAVLVDAYDRPRFLQFVQTQVSGGITGPRLVTVIGDELRDYDVVPQFGVVRPAEVVTIVEDDDFFPPVVTSHVARVRAHPHGGPPGQLKKDLGLQTGAEVVHGTARARTRDAVTRTVRTDRDRPARVTRERVRPSERRVVTERPAKRRVERSERRAPAPRVERVREPKRLEKPRVERQQRVERPKPQRVERGGGGHAPAAHGGGSHGGGQGKGKGKGKG